MSKYATIDALQAHEDVVRHFERKQNLHYADVEVRVAKLEKALLACVKRVFALEQGAEKK